MATEMEITKILGILAATYPRFKLTKETIKVYIMLLSDIPGDELKVAALQCAASRDFFPSVHELRQTVIDVRCKVQGLPTAFEAWQDLRKAGPGKTKIANEGEDGKWYIEEVVYKFLHPIVPHVGELLGWPGSFPGDNDVADRAHYFKAYNQALSDSLNDAAMLPEVQEYIEGAQAELLEAGGEMQELASLAKRMSVK